MRPRRKRWGRSWAAPWPPAAWWPFGAGWAWARPLSPGVLGCTGRVTSPTFTIVNEYRGNIPLFHFDMYRLDSSDALFDIGWEDYLDRGGVCAVEWSENVADAMPEGTVYVTIERAPEGENTRIITITGGGAAL